MGYQGLGWVSECVAWCYPPTDAASQNKLPLLAPSLVTLPLRANFHLPILLITPLADQIRGQKWDGWRWQNKSSQAVGGYRCLINKTFDFHLLCYLACLHVVHDFLFWKEEDSGGKNRQLHFYEYWSGFTSQEQKNFVENMSACVVMIFYFERSIQNMTYSGYLWHNFVSHR